MSRRRLTWLVVTWLAAAAVATGWVASQTDDDVTLGNAFLVGALIATLLSMGINNMGRR